MILRVTLRGHGSSALQGLSSAMADNNGDERRVFVTSLLACLWGRRTTVSDSDATSHAALSTFLDDPQCPVLLAQRFPSASDDKKGGDTIVLTTQVQKPQDSKDTTGPTHEAVFVKLSPVPLTPETMATQVQVTSLAAQTPLRSLYQSLHHVYAPRLLQTTTANATPLSAKLKETLVELDAGLGASLVVAPNADEASPAALMAIATLDDEFAFWASDHHRNATRARKISDAFDSIQQRYATLETLTIDDMGDLLDETKEALDDIWRKQLNPPFPQARMDHVLGLVGHALAAFVVARTKDLDLWTSAFVDVKATLERVGELCDQWVATIEALTTGDWPYFDEHKWDGGPSRQDAHVRALATRIDDVARLRSTYEELASLLPRSVEKDATAATVFAPFRGLQPLYYNPYSDKQWHAAVAAFEATLRPLEAQVGAILREHLGATGKPNATVRLLQRFGNLLCRPSLASTLAGERDTLLTQLVAHLEQLQSDFETRSSSHRLDHLGKLLSPHVNVIVWCHILFMRVIEVRRLATLVLSDLPGFRALRDKAGKLENALHDLLMDKVVDWQAEIKAELKQDSGAALRISGKLMYFDKGMLVVNFSEFLVTLLRDVRQLTEISVQHKLQRAKTSSKSEVSKTPWVPDDVRRLVEDAEKYYRFGVTLKKVANFYNTIGSQIIPEQKPMLLKSLLRFDEMVQTPDNSNSRAGDKQQKPVTWNNLQECNDYVNQLQDEADKLATEIRRLKHAHEKLSDEFVALMDIDLLRSPDKWKAKWDDIKKGVAMLSKKYESKDTQWLLFWDHQLYKVLESGYQLGLEMLHENLPDVKEIRADLMFPKGGSSSPVVACGAAPLTLVLDPPVEELRTKYYKALKTFVARPNRFPGFGNKKVFAAMCDANAKNLVSVYATCEQLFFKVEMLLYEYEPWSVVTRLPGNDNQVNDDALLESTLHDPSDWELNFKSLKIKRKEVDKIADFVKIDCIQVSLMKFKDVVRNHMQRFQNALLDSLYRSTLDDVQTVEEFVTGAMKKLNTRPHSISEISHAQGEWKEIDAKRSAMQTHYDQAGKKKKLLDETLAGKVNTAFNMRELERRLSELPAQWDNFEVALEAFNDMIEESRERLKEALDGQVIECNSEIDKFRQRWQALRPVDVSSWRDNDLQQIYVAMDEWRTKLAALKTESKTLAENCAAFRMPDPVFDGLEALDADVDAIDKNWTMYKEYRTEIQAMAAQDWITFSANMFALQDCAQKWVDAAKQQATESHNSKGAAVSIVLDRMQEFLTHVKRAMPALKLCRGEPFKEDHWTELLLRLGMPRDVRTAALTLGHFLDRIEALESPQMLQFVKGLHARAQGEVAIRDALKELRGWTGAAKLSLLEHVHDGRRVCIIKDWKEIMLELGDNQSLLASLKDSQFFKPFEQEARQYEEKMTLLDQALAQLNIIQRKWVFLEPIFSKGALPSEQKRFQGVDSEFVEIMSKLESDPMLFALADDMVFPKLLDRLAFMVDQLERCQKALSDFVEEKRSRMPRFYFIGDEDLLEILGQSQNPAVIQSHLKKLYQGVYRVEFSEQKDQIVAMCSSANEKVMLQKPVQVTNQVEGWLENFTEEMRRTIRVLVAQCIASKAPDYTQFPSQVLCLAEQIRFCQQAEDAIKNGGVSDLKRSLQETLRELTSLDLTTEPLMSLKVKALVLDLVHHIDVCDQLIHENCNSVKDWIWQKQLRFYLDGKNQRAVIKMNDATFDYTYEYQGNASKLVHTPLTDKCYLTLTQGMHMGFGGNPYGPAGTGKTESVKALGGQFGRQVLVFNCDEGIDFQSMGRIFIGLVKCGAWGCFDEFNRLKEDQLSAISQQIQVIQDAIKDRVKHIQLLNRDVDVDFNAGIFVTLNPAGKGYGGRSKLPDNLKALFRPVAMGRPDNNLIAEVILYSEGFSEAKAIASKVVSLYSLSAQLLSQQQHYDWGLRALKAVLNTAGKLLSSAKKELAERTESAERMTPAQETEVLIKAVRINTLSKLTFVDSARFLALIGDVFPGVNSADLEGGKLAEAIREVMVAKPFFLQIDELQIRKMLQLKESLDQRMGCVVVGPSGSGKSAVWQILQAALIKCGQLVKTHVMNPKSMPRERLLGHMDLDTREWSDGVLTDAARKVVKEPETVRSWIICDGDVDPEWIESLNSVLDDNHLLTLPNGERINFGPNVNFVFETHDLRFASPATISRMGMIFLSDEDVDVQRLVSKWLLYQPEDRRNNLRNWIEELFTKALEELNKFDLVVDTTTVGTIMNGLSHVATATSRPEFVVAMIRGLGANLSVANRTSFAKSMFMMANERPPDVGAPLDCYCVGSVFHSYETKRDTYGAMDGKLDRSDLAACQDAVVPTISVQRGLKTIEPWVENMEPFILVGPEGCGKNMLIRQAFRTAKNVNVTVLHCNAQTTADHIIHKIAQCCSLYSTTAGRVYRPRDCERLVLYLKDINLPKPDEYDTCMLIAFLQQLLTFNGFYDQNLEFLSIDKVQIVASMNAATTVGRHPLSTRFTAVVRVAYMDYPSSDELQVVYSTFLEAVFNDKSVAATWREGRDSRDKLARSMVEIFDATKTKFTVDDHRHYLFTPRDLTKWVFSLVRYDLGTEEVLDIVAYEGRRLFRDRLVDEENVSKFDGIVNSVLKQQWRHSAKLQDVFFSSLHNRKAGGADAGELSAVAAPLVRISSEEFGQVITQGMTLYEREEKDLHVLVFDEILDHLAIVERVVSEPGGSMLLVGNSGVGRRSATTLVSYMLGYNFFTPSATRQYDAATFRNDLKSLLVKAGVEGQHHVLYLEDHHFAQDDAILEITNSLLSSGEVPGLYTHEEIEPLISPLKEKMLDAVGSMSSSSSSNIKTTYDFFVSRVCQYVHIVLGMDSRHPQFLMRCESNPALYTRCAITWMGEWSSRSMKKIPEMLLTGSNLLDVLPKTMPLITSVYETCKRTLSGGATPREFVGFLGSWRVLYEAKSKQVQQEINHLKSGLNKLEGAATTVDELSRNARIKKQELGEAQVAADTAMEEIQKALDRAATNRSNVEQLKKQLAEAEKATTARKKEIEVELADITPILQSAKQAVGDIKSDNINEIRSLKMPPEPIHDVLSAVLMLLGIQDTSWNSMKKFLGNRGVKEDILNYDARRITGEISKAVGKLVKNKAASFDHDTITRVSVAAAPLASWVKANLKYSMVLNKIEPLEADLAEAKRSLETSQQKLHQYEEDLAKIDKKVAHMKTQFAEKTAEAEKLRMDLERAEKTLNKAQDLLSQLSGEQKRWSEQVKDLELRQSDLPMRMLLAAAFTTFLGKCSEDVRESITKEWERDMLEISSTSSRGFEYRKLMSTESEMLTWKSMGLPSDDLSMENALVVVHSCAERCPFIIDPASASTTWLKAELEKDATRPLTFLQAQDARFVNTVEQAVRFGRTLVILEVDTVEPYLYPLVRKDLVHQGPRYVVALGDKVVDYNENFRLFLVTRNPAPPLAPDALAIVNVVNFTVTKSGLEGQLLGVTIQHEQPELEQEKSELLKQEETYKVDLAKLEKQLVEALATSEGDILENTILIDSLTKTKEMSAAIEQALERSAKKSEELDEKRDTYRPFAHEGAKMFFIVKQLSAVNHMYRFSLASFLGLFKSTLGTKMESANTRDRIHRLIPILEYKVLMYVGRALFKEHRPMFGMHLVHGMHFECFDKNEYEVFCGDAVSSSEKSSVALPEWASAERKEAFTRLVETLPRLAQQCKFDITDLWIRWSKSPECEQAFHAKMDKSNSGGLTAFQKLLVVQALRPDRLQSAIIQFICGVMSLKSLTPPPLDFKAIALEEASHLTPVLLMTTAGADPSKELEEVATSVVGREHYFEVAMGGGQQEKALTLLRMTAKNGEWLCLQNLHLVVAWLPVLEKELNILEVNAKFRLWLTTEPHDAFPLVLLEQSIKITFESPPGLKKNMQRTYATWNPQFIDKGSLPRAQLLFLLAFFHALLQERRTYIPQGWTKFYEFSFGDFRAGTNVIELGCKTASERTGGIDWATLHGLMENAIYGGRVDNPYDLRVLRCNIAEYFSNEVLSSQKSLLRGIKMPQSSRHEDFVELIDRLPDSDAPVVFGLPDNIERSMQRTLSSEVIAQLKMLSSSEEAADKFDRETWRAQLGPLLESWAKWTTNLALDSSSSTSSSGKNLTTMAPADAFVALESEYAQELIVLVHQSLQGLKKVIYGTGLLTPAIQTVGSALLKGSVPRAWSAKWDASESASVWLRSLALRRRALVEWHDASSSGKLLARGLDLSDLLHPGTFLNALRQQSARELKCSMDGMKLLSCWEKDKVANSKLEWFEITHLLLQGASFEGGNLVEAMADAQELVAVPSCFVAYAREDAEEIYPKENCIKVPLYYATDRERMLVEIAMPIAGDHARWILAGVALFLGE